MSPIKTFDERFSVLVGNYGSGKTELAIAVARAARGRVALVDLDIVNPYFRSAERSALLSGEGVEVFMPSFAMSTVDIPALPAELMKVFQQPYDRVIIDVGGDDTGAVALGGFAPAIRPVRSEMRVYYVVNACRPFSATPEVIAEMFGLVAARARLTPDALVNNTNLQQQTTPEVLAQGHAIVCQAAQTLGVPVAFASGLEGMQSALPPGTPYFAFEPVMLPEWMEDCP